MLLLSIDIEKIIFNSHNESHCRHDEDNHTDSGVDQPHASKVEMRAHRIDKECDEEPPKHCAAEDEEVSDERHKQWHVLLDEIKSGE